MGSRRLVKPGRILGEVPIDAQSVCVCLLLSFFFTADFFLAVMQYSLLSGHHPLVLLALLLYENRFLCLISSLPWRSSCCLFQHVTDYSDSVVPVQCPSLKDVFKKEERERGNQTLILPVSWRNHWTAEAMSLKRKGLLRLWNSQTLAQHGWARAQGDVRTHESLLGSCQLPDFNWGFLIFTLFGGFFGTADKRFHSSLVRLHRDSRGVSLIQGCWMTCSYWGKLCYSALFSSWNCCLGSILRSFAYLCL